LCFRHSVHFCFRRRDALFRPHRLDLPALLITCTLASLLSIALALLIVAFSHNRVEGMALAKLSGVFLLGLPVPFFLSSGVQYLFSPLPSFWIAKFCLWRQFFARRAACDSDVIFMDSGSVRAVFKEAFLTSGSSGCPA
jgi:hypothetical protein